MEPPIRQLIEAADRGDRASAEQLFAALYSELRRMAQRELAKQRGPATLGATTLLHETYLDMATRHGPSFPDRARFMGYAAKVMRGLIIDHVRSRLAQKRGGKFELTSVTGDVAEIVPESPELEKIGDALDELAEADPALAQIVDLKFFCGFSFDEIAAMRGVSGRTVNRMWEKARIYLHRTLRSDLPYP